ncbi:hypothetical protein [Photobacterium damselae]|uniref:hypothetical protein n=1 Tax=Photobacterium damselae TaxID=38293 RepID=UPI001EFCC45D|nr:hypothetical protein [Photobacterium damselae]MCG9704922.1 hypothetical protein [Photobacterium damselae]
MAELLERYLYLDFTFDVTKALSIIKNEKIPKKTLNVHRLKSYFQTVEIDQETLKHVNISDPVILATIIVNNVQTHLLIDGNHRFWKVCSEHRNLETIPGYILSLEQSNRIITHTPRNCVLVNQTQAVLTTS